MRKRPPQPNKDIVLKNTQTEMSKLRPLSARRQRAGDHKDKSNPFAPPDVTDVFSEQDSLEEQRKRLIKEKQKMTLVQRQMLPSGVTSQKAIRERIERRFATNDKDNELDIKGVTETRQRQQHTAQIIQDQREIFLSNLLIDRHQKELERLNYLKHTKKAKLEEMQLQLEEDQNRSKTVRRQLEMTRDREKLHMEEQHQKRAEIESKVKRKKINVEALATELNNLEQKRENYKLCEQLILEMEEYFGKKPQTVHEFVEVFDRMETDNIFLIQNKQRIESRNEGQYQDLIDEIQKTKEENKQLEEELNSLKAKRDSIQTLIEKSQNTIDIDSELANLQKIVAKTYQKCLGTPGTNQNCITMLQVLESNVESMIKKVDLIENMDLALKQVKQLKNERKEAVRIAGNQRLDSQKSEKRALMLRRATMPVKKRSGRPLVERILTGRTNKVNKDKIQKEKNEREKLEQLLFGDDIYD